jgi:hypothetical protein
MAERGRRRAVINISSGNSHVQHLIQVNASAVIAIGGTGRRFLI